VLTLSLNTMIENWSRSSSPEAQRSQVIVLRTLSITPHIEPEKSTASSRLIAQRAPSATGAAIVRPKMFSVGGFVGAAEAAEATGSGRRAASNPYCAVSIKVSSSVASDIRYMYYGPFSVLHKTENGPHGYSNYAYGTERT
jgi:hypothetical protein